MGKVKNIKLNNAVTYSDQRIECSKLSPSNYIGTDNLLQNKLGKVEALYTPVIGKTTRFNEGDILIGNIRPYLKKIWYASCIGGSSADVLTLHVKKNFDSKFIYYAVLRDDFFNHVMNGSKGTKMPRGDKDQILDFLIPDFTYPKQKAISETLSSIDNKIASNNKIIELMKSMSKITYDYWFVQFNFPDNKGNPYKSAGGDMEYHPELKRDIPKGWKVGSLLDIADYTNGLPCQKFRPKEGDDSLRVIKIKEMHEGFSGESELVSSNISKDTIINNGDVLFSWSASLEVQIWTAGIGALNQHIFKVTSTTYPKSYYYFELLNYLQHFKMMAENRKTTMGHITKDHLKQSRVVIPPDNIIEKLDTSLSPLIMAVIKLNEENHELTDLRDWLLPLLMNEQAVII